MKMASSNRFAGALLVIGWLPLSCNVSVDSPDPPTDSGDGDDVSGGDGDGSSGGDGSGGASDPTGNGGTGGFASGGGDGDGNGSGGIVAAGGAIDPGTGGTGGSTPVDTGLVPAFVGQGHLGRTVVSCDDGRTWIFEQSNDVGTGTCWSGENEIECDHDPGAGRGLAAGGGRFFAMFGWGTPSTLRTSSDGESWDVRIGDVPDQRFGGVGYIDGTLLAAGIRSRVSQDDGLTWSDPIETGLSGGNVRRAGTAGAHFVIVTDDAVVLSADKGATWFQPTNLPDGCGAGIQTRGGIAYGNGVIVVMGDNGLACSSTDGGVNFTASPIGGDSDSHLVWSGSDFVVYGGGNAYRSADGEEWTETALSSSYSFGPVAVSDSGTFVAVEGGWGDSVWYQNQEFYRSEDGIDWETLPEGSFEGGHPMRTLAFGYIEPSSSCPLD